MSCVDQRLAALAGMALVALACRAGPAPSEMGSGQVFLQVDVSAAVAEVDERYLSVALDVAQVLGGEFWSKGGRATSVAGDAAVPPLDLTSPRLISRAAALRPAFLRVGGTAADVVDYQLDGERPLAHGNRLRLTGTRWQQLVAFARAIDFPLVFALNAGPASRDERGAWEGDNAAQLVRAAAGAHDPVAVWELGNEVNAYPFIHGLWHRVAPARLGADLAAARRVLERSGGGARLAGPSSAFWPVLGELNPTMEGALGRAGSAVQVVTWHYYPQQSRRCPVAVRRAGAQTLLDPDHLDELSRWAAEVRLARDSLAPRAELWLGETGHAQCGGEPGLSDAFASSLWWIDELGLAARTGNRVVIRQTLAGADYGLLDGDSLAPRPDYWASALWKRTMGARVLGVTPPARRSLRAYAHCAAGRAPGAVAVAAVNLDRQRPAEVTVPWSADGAEVFIVTAPSLQSVDVSINGAAPESAPAAPLGRALRLPPLSYALAVFPAASAPACP